MATESLAFTKAASNDLSPFNTKDKLRSLLTDELVIALCGPIGSPHP
jgi:uncharacterized protein (DUF2237 family)